jgi:hypothetical protein
MAELFDPIAGYKKQLQQDIAAWEAELEEINFDTQFVEPYKAQAAAQIKERIARARNAIEGFDKPLR